MIDGRKLLILDGPSASGKSTILDLLLTSVAPSFTVAQRITTRPKRKGDEDDPAYIFSDMASFEQMIEDGLLLEYKHYLFGMSYGLPLPIGIYFTGGREKCHRHDQFGQCQYGKRKNP